MTKAKILLVLAFLVVCAAGVVVGTAVDRSVLPPPVVEKPQPEFRDLHLSSDQQREMHQIWDKFGKQRGQLYQKRHQLDQQREESFRGLLTPDQLSQYEQIQRTFEQQRKEAEDEVQRAFRAAEDQTQTILTPEQLKKLDEMRRRMPHGNHGGPGMGPPPGMGGPGMGGPGMGGPGFPHHEHRHSSTRPSTRPSGMPTTGTLNPEG